MTEVGPPLHEICNVEPHQVALTDDRRSVTWAEMDDRTKRMANGMAALGASPGDHVAIVANNRVEFYEALIACMRSGLVVTPVKTGWTVEEIDYLLHDASSVVVVTDTNNGRGAAAARGLGVVDLGELDGGSHAAWLDAQSNDPLPFDRAGYRMAYTSGTTGRPKAVKLSFHGASPFSQSFPAWSAFAKALHMPLDGPHLMCSAMYHGAPLGFSMGALAGGASIRILDRFDAAEVLDVMATEEIRSTCMVPTMFRRMLDLDVDDAAFELPRLGAVCHGGEPCPRPLKQAMLDLLGPVLVEYYGFTEGGFSSVTSTEWIERPGTVGRPLLGMEVLIVDDHGVEVPTGERGTVYFRHPDGPRFEYRGEPDKTESAYLDANAFTVGDIGYVDADGYLYLSGRTTDVIISAGVNIYPAQIEDVIAGVDGVAECCVVGGPHDDRGEVPVATLALQVGASEAEVIAAASAACETHLARYERPNTWNVVELLPRDGTGKLLRREVRSPLWEGRDDVFAN